MNPIQSNQSKIYSRGIMSMATILAVGSFSLGFLFIAADGALREFFKNRNERFGGKSFYAAEAAGGEGAYQFIHSPSYSGGAADLLNDSSSGGITVTPLGWPYYKVAGAAGNEKTEHAIARKITIFAEGLAFDHAIYTEGALTMKGNASTTGNVFGNDGIELSGSAELNGDAYSPGEVEGEDNVNGEIFENAEPIPAPIIDMAPYKDEAGSASPSTLFTTANSAENFLKNETRNAIVFASTTSAVNIQNSTLTGSLVTLGNMKLTGGTYTASENHAAIIVGGNLEVAGGVSIYGVVYVLGSTKFTGTNNKIEGSLISVNGADVDLGGTVTVNYVPAAWQDLTGLSTSTSSAPPRILSWSGE